MLVSALSVGLALACLSSSGRSDPLWLTVEVLNREAYGGHSILHLEDLVGPSRRRDLRGLPRPRVVVAFSSSLSDCDRARTGLCGDVAQIQKELGQGVLFLALIMARPEEVARARSSIPYSTHPFPISLDEHGISAHLLGFDKPGVFVVFDSAGRMTAVSPPSDPLDDMLRGRWLARLRATLREVLMRQQEADG